MTTATTTRYAVCSFCDSICGLAVEVADNRVVSIRGDEADPISAGYMCPKGFANQALLEDPDRLRRPVMRSGSEWRWPSLAHRSHSGVVDVIAQPCACSPLATSHLLFHSTTRRGELWSRNRAAHTTLHSTHFTPWRRA